jgi:8-oxo-dGTP diphosphatase
MTADSINSPTIRVSLIIINQNQEILLVKHRKKDKEYWVLPGGHLDYGETIAECALRELKEETSLDGQFERIVFISESLAPDGSRHIINIFALIKVIGGQIQIGSDEDILCEVAYKPLSELQNLVIYPDIRLQILQNQQNNWPNSSIELLQTPWT